MSRGRRKKTETKQIRYSFTESWPSGLRQHTANVPWNKPHRWFKSSTLRHFLENELGYKHKSSMNEYLKERYHRLKREAFDILGGVCAHCQSTLSLQVDHINPKTKSFNVTRKLRSLPWSNILSELKKCQLLCRLCHKEKTKSEKSYGKKLFGSDNPNARLKEDQVLEIKRGLAQHISMAELSRTLGIGYENIKAIKSGRAWRQVIL